MRDPRGAPGEALHVGGGVESRGRGQDDRRVRAVASRNPQQTANHNCHMRPKYPAVGVAFINYDKPHVPQDPREPGVRPTQRGVHHVRIRQQQARVIADRAPCFRGRIPVVGGGHDPPKFRNRTANPVQPGPLVTAQSLRGSQV